MDIRRRISEATQLIQKKIPYGSHVIKPKKEWMQTVPTKDCDVVMLMSPDVTEATINWLHITMKSCLPHLKISLNSHAATKSFAFHIQATFEGLVKGGEEMRLVKKTKSQFGGDLRELSKKEISMFQDSEDEEAFFTTQERQNIVLYILNSLRTPYKEVIGGASIRKGQTIVPKLLSKGIIRNLFPLHQKEKLKPLRSKWVPGFYRTQPIDEIQQYFGSQIAMYFAWLGHYTVALTIPAILGIIFWRMEDKGLVAFAFLNVVWGSVWLEAWKRKGAEIAYSWGTLDAHLNTFSEPRPLFKGDLKVCSVTGRLEPHYPSWKRNIVKYLVSLPLIMVAIFLVFRVMLIMLQFQDVCNEYFSSKEGLSFLSFAPKALMAVPISLFDKWYTKLALRLNKMENYRSEEDHQNQLIIKLLLFRFVNSFLSLFYIAFYLQDLARLREQLAALLVTKQLTGNFTESVLPYLKKRLQLAKLSFKLFGALGPSGGNSKNLSTEEERKSASDDRKERNSDDDDDDSVRMLPKGGVSGEDDSQGLQGTSDPSKDRQIPQAEVESEMATYDGTYKDYLEVFVQFGYVTLFSSAFPLAAACALITNLVEIRSDAFKFCYVFQRPFGHRAQSIGVWQVAMELMGVISIIVNCALIGLSGQIQQVYPDITTGQTILLVIVLEHVLIALKYGISYAIPDVPEWVEKNIARKEFQRRETLKGNPSVTQKEFQSHLPEKTSLTATADQESCAKQAEQSAY